MRLAPLAPRPRSVTLVGILALAMILLAGCDQVAGMIASARPPAFEGQTAEAVQMGSGTTSAGPWTGWLYPTATGSCTVVVAGGRPESPMCSSGSAPFDGEIGLGVSFGDDGTLAYGSTANPAADVAVITLATGAQARIPVVRPGGPVANGNGYFMAWFDPGTEINLIVLVDESGAELDSYPFGW